MKRLDLSMKFWKIAGALPVIALLILVPILHAKEKSVPLESPLLLAFLNTIFLGCIPLAVAYMAAKSHRATGAFGFLVVGGGLVFFGVSSLFAGWVMPLAGGPNPTVTLHNLGSLFAGLCQLVGAHYFLRAFVGAQSSRFRIVRYDILFVGIVALLSLTALLVFKGVFPVFFDPLTGPSLLRQLILGGAIIMFAAAGFLFMEIYSAIKTEFAWWYGLALWLIAIGLACVFLQHSVGSILGWTGRGAQYLGGVYFIIAFLQGRHELPLAYQGSNVKPAETLWPYLEQKITERTAPLTRMNETLQKEIIERKRTEEALRKSETQFRQLFNVAAVPLCFVNKKGVIVDFNERFIQTFGYTHEDVPTLAEWWQLAYPDPEYRRRVIDTWDAAVKRAEKKGIDIEPIEYRVTCKNGDERTIIISGTTIGENFLATFFDITERKQAEEELEKHRFHLEEKVTERTAELERMNRIFIGRELKMIELKKRIAELEKEIGDDKL